MKRVYVMGPMSGQPDLNSESFSRAFEYFTTKGYHVVSPHHIERPLRLGTRDVDLGKGEIYRQVMPMDLFALASADLVVALPGWEHSPGCGLERHAADLFGLPVYAYTTEGYNGDLDEWFGELLDMVIWDNNREKDLGYTAFVPGEEM